MQVKATFIHWDTSSDEGEKDPFGALDLPSECVIEVDAQTDDEVDMRIADALSDKYGFCIYSCSWEKIT